MKSGAMRFQEGAVRPGPVVEGVPTTLERHPGGAGLDRWRPAWESLAARSLEANVFYEPALLLPALRHLQPEEGVDVVLVFAQLESEGPRLCALLPVVTRGDYRGLALRVLAPWKHLHCFLCTPLVDREYAAAGLAGLLAFAEGERAGLLELPETGAGGDFEAALERAAAAARGPLRATESHERALFRPRDDADAHLRSAQPRRHRRKEIQRLRRRLEECGAVEFAAFAAGDDLEEWLADFLALEAAGWKGRAGTAIDQRPAERAFFLEAARESAERGRLMLHALRLDGRPIAMKCNFLASGAAGQGRGGFAFKIAHDESFSRFSPGVLLENEHVAHLHAQKDLAWLDSCAAADHPMIDRLWPDRRRIATFLLATGSLRGRLLVHTHPGLRWLRGVLRAGRTPAESGDAP